jgi:CubicO group peptidase (beta-lactamase class C family)
MKKFTTIAVMVASVALVSIGAARAETAVPSAQAIDREVGLAMRATGARGLALAVIDDGRVAYVASYGERNAAGEPLRRDTIMYGASLTKAVFAYTVMQLVDEGRLDLDRPIGDMLPRPLPEYVGDDIENRYARWSDLAGDDRWRLLTPRILLTHSSGFANFGFLEPDGKLRFHFQPGSRYGYSGAGIMLLQFAIEEGLGLDIGAEMERRVFAPLGMTRTSMMWRADFAGNLADGWDLSGKPEPHDERSAPRAAGSMDTTIEDFSRFAAAFASGGGLSDQSWRGMTTPQLPITTASQFPVLQPELPVAERRADLAASLGLLVFDGPQGAAFMRSGHNDFTGNTWVCVKAGRRCLVLLSNDVRAEAAFPHLVAFVLGETGAPWSFVNSDVSFWDGPGAGR